MVTHREKTGLATPPSSARKPGAGRRAYRQRCGIARALDLVGERWTLLLVRDLLLGPRRFSDLLAGLPGLTPKLLSERLRRLREHGLVSRVRLRPPSGASVYELTERGRELEPVLMALDGFGQRWLGQPEAEGVRSDLRWLMVSLKRRYRGGAPPAVVELRSPERAFTITLQRDAIDVRDGSPAHPDVTVSGSERSIRDLLVGRISVRAADAAAIVIRGDRWVVHALVDALAPWPDLESVKPVGGSR